MNFCYGVSDGVSLVCTLKALLWNSLVLEAVCSEDTMLFGCGSRGQELEVLSVGCVPVSAGVDGRAGGAEVLLTCAAIRVGSVSAPANPAVPPPGCPQGWGISHCRGLGTAPEPCEPPVCCTQSKGQAFKFLILAHKIWSMPPPCACALGYSSCCVVPCCGSVSLLAQESSGAELGFCSTCGCWSWLSVAELGRHQWLWNYRAKGRIWNSFNLSSNSTQRPVPVLFNHTFSVCMHMCHNAVECPK